MLPPFAYFWNQAHGAGYAVLVAHYDVQPPSLPPNFETYSIGKQEDFTWSSGLIAFLKTFPIYSDVILLVLEDYFMDTPINWSRIHSLNELMKRHSDIAKVDLTDDRLKVEHATGTYDGIPVVLSENDAPFQTSLQAALWRKDFLLRFLEPSENAWQFEKKGTKRVIEARKAGTFGGGVIGTPNHPMHYINAVGGEGNFPGQITEKYMPQWMRDECRAKGWTHG